MRIALVHVGWPIQSYARDLVNGLAGQGHDVDFIATAEDDHGLIDIASIRGRLTLLGETGPGGRLVRRLRRRMAAFARIPLSINPPAIVREADRLFAGRSRYDLLIGVEKAGLELAVHHGERAGIPVVYYSLELYVDDHPDRSRFAWQRTSEIRCHRRASGTLIQDRFRWEMLQQANHVGRDAVFFLPVGIATGFDQRPTIPRHLPAADDCRLLSFGVQGRNRYTQELIGLAPTLPPGTRLHLHGPCHEAWIRRLDRNKLPPNVLLSADLLPETDLPTLLAEADIGLALYRPDVANDRLTAYSSQKVALYLQAGLPIIAFRSESYEDLLRRFKCGELIDSVDELGPATERIRKYYSDYSEHARQAFAAVYRLDQYWPELSSFLAALRNTEPVNKP